MTKPIRVGLVYGGRSGEHEVSLETAFAVAKAFDFDKYALQPIYIAKNGEWRAVPQLTAPPEAKEQLTEAAEGTPGTPLALAAMFGRQAPAAADSESAAGAAEEKLRIASVAPAHSPLDEARESAPAAAAKTGGAALDVVFPLLHGTYGEDGTIQGLFEMAGIPYVGAGVLASAVGMDKVAMKKIFAQAGLPQCLYRYFTKGQWEKEREFHLLEIETALGYPCFVKPANLGSSVGISKARNRQELMRAVQEAFRFDRKVLVEEFVNAREIEVGVLGNDEPRASVPGEIVSSNEFYDYKAKYLDGKSAMNIPADLPADTVRAVRKMAIQAFQAIEASGLSRVDFFLRREDNALLVNEINTMPGFTPFSMYPLLWRETGLSYRELLDELLRLAMERYRQRESIQYGFEVQ